MELVEIYRQELFQPPGRALAKVVGAAAEVEPDWMSRAEGLLGQVNSLLEKWGELSQNPVFQQMLSRFQPPGQKRLPPGQGAANNPGNPGNTQAILALIMQKWGKKTVNQILKELGPLPLEDAIRKALGG